MFFRGKGIGLQYKMLVKILLLILLQRTQNEYFIAEKHIEIKIWPEITPINVYFNITDKISFYFAIFQNGSQK